MVTQRPYPREAADPYCLRAGEAEQLLGGHPWRRFAVLGDGIAEGAGEPAPGYADQPWCDRIAAALRVYQPDLAYLNLGASNTSAAQVRATQLPTALVFAPDLALVACGGYDILQPVYDPAAVSAEIREIVSALVAKGARVITVGPFDRSYSPAVPDPSRKPLQERIHSLSQSTREVAKEFGTLYIDLTWHPAGPEPDLYSSDGRHNSMRGHAIAAAEVIRGLGADLANAGGQGQQQAGEQRLWQLPRRAGRTHDRSDRRPRWLASHATRARRAASARRSVPTTNSQGGCNALRPSGPGNPRPAGTGPGTQPVHAVDRGRPGGGP